MVLDRFQSEAEGDDERDQEEENEHGIVLRLEQPEIVEGMKDDSGGKPHIFKALLLFEFLHREEHQGYSSNQ